MKKTPAKENQGANKKEGIENEITNNPQIPKEIRQFMSMSTQRISGTMPHPIISKINEKHIDKLIEYSDKDDERQFKDNKQGRIFALIYILVAVGFFVFLTIVLVNKDIESYKEVIKMIVIFGGGFGAGYGFKKYKNKI